MPYQYAVTELEELAQACIKIKRSINDIRVVDDRYGLNVRPASHRFMATWGDLDAQMGVGPTPQAAMWELIDFTEGRP